MPEVVDSGDVEMSEGKPKRGRCNVRIEHAGKDGGLAAMDGVEVDEDENHLTGLGKVQSPPNYVQVLHVAEHPLPPHRPMSLGSLRSQGAPKVYPR